MTAVMTAQPGLGLTAPSSRQDIISALLNDYGNSFGQGDTSPYAPSPVPAIKELPPPPPDSNEKPLPPAMMRFQLRVDEPGTPQSFSSQRSNSIEQPSKIIFRSMSRGSKPASLKLKKSNGSTAEVPTPPPPAPPKDESSAPEEAFEDRPPPPPPKKSERRNSARQASATMGNRTSKEGRRDSKDPENEQAQTKRSQSNQEMKRKPVPPPSNTKKFVSLADLQKGPRGRSIAPTGTTASDETPSPAPQLEARKPVPPRKEEQSRVPSPPRKETESRRPSPPRREDGSRQRSPPRSSHEEAPRNALSGLRPTFNENQLPPTPDPQPPVKDTPLPVPPRKVFAGLPSNPRSKGSATPTSAQPLQSKSSTGFDIIKTSKPASAISTIRPDTITPDLTPNPETTEANQSQQAASRPTLASTVQGALRRPQSPDSPLSEEDSRRPFSFEAVTPAPSQKPAQQQTPQQQPPPPALTTSPDSPDSPDSPVSPISSPPPAIAQFPPRTTSRPAADPTRPQQPQTISNSISRPTSPPADFVPLTVAPIAVPARPITAKQLDCYTNHALFSEYMSRFQRTACMVCGKSERGVRCSCSYCMLHLCVTCRDELRVVPGRNLSVFLREKGVELGKEEQEKGGMPSVVVWGAEEGGEGRDQDFS
ncbi:hypothetical protein K491DRAFT_203098 [Lophiostoma macrostomum CBS 122681]|uniref:Uncharacterized protein n=1 Tax=Lophiostoma macrostomum CBS 122681 TaxID=1314788 RepID=A0A6A6TJT0_9PLEO|nr:hypothetical protein K491DRAFT_203098 [Lophiostoma macrostomum CBS 122681]